MNVLCMDESIRKTRGKAGAVGAPFSTGIKDKAKGCGSIDHSARRVFDACMRELAGELVSW